MLNGEQKLPEPWIEIFYPSQLIEVVLNTPAGEFIDSLRTDEALYCTFTAALDFGINNMPSKYTEIVEAADERGMSIKWSDAEELVSQMVGIIDESMGADGNISPAEATKIVEIVKGLVRGTIKYKINKITGETELL